MQATLTINSRGVVTLPAKLRQALGLKADDQLIAETTPQGLLLRPAVTLPLEIYTALVVEYLLLILLTSWGVRRLEKRMSSAPR